MRPSSDTNRRVTSIALAETTYSASSSRSVVANEIAASPVSSVVTWPCATSMPRGAVLAASRARWSASASWKYHE